jgi:hypothetical protein
MSPGAALQIGLPVDWEVNGHIYDLYSQLEYRPNGSSIGAVLMEIPLGGLQGGFRHPIVIQWTVLSAGYPAANQSYGAGEVRYRQDQNVENTRCDNFDRCISHEREKQVGLINT